MINFVVNPSMMENFDKDIEHLPIYQKAGEIYDTLSEIADLVSEENDYLQMVAGQMVANAVLIQAKIAGAEAGDIYDIRMQNAAFIRQAAMDLTVIDHAFVAHGFDYVEYFKLVRERIEEFRLLFISWIESFDKGNYFIDRWGLFNPPGVGPFDKDPDEDISWDEPDFGDE